MSIESMTIALHHSRATGTAKVVLIGIANHDGDGGAWPSIATLTKYAGLSERSVQYAIKQLEELGEIRRRFQEGGLSTRANNLRPNLYEFLLRCPPGCDRSAQHNVTPVPFEAPDAEVVTGPWPGSCETPVRGEASCTPGVKPVAPLGVKPVAPKPSGEPSGNSPRDRTAVRSRPEPSATTRQKRYIRHMQNTIGGEWSDTFDDAEQMTFDQADGWIGANLGTYRAAGGGRDVRPF